jgi:pantetheine-phosphate adenylyltransferase
LSGFDEDYIRDICYGVSWKWDPEGRRPDNGDIEFNRKRQQCESEEREAWMTATGSATPLRIAVYGLSADPPTNGHIWIVQRALEMFDMVCIAVGDNPAKKHSFSCADRIAMMKESLPYHARVAFGSLGSALLAKYAATLGAKYLVRGVRNSADFLYEQAMSNINAKISPGMTTVLLTPPRELVDTSSSVVKGLVNSDGWEEIVSTMVPHPVLERLKQWRKE